MAEHGRDDGPEGRRILVIANETVDGKVLNEVIRFRARNVAGEVLVVAPAPTPRLRRRVSEGADVDGPRSAAEARLSASLRRLAAAGVRVRGEVGDATPLQAMADALAGFTADEVIVATHPADRSRWLAHDLVGRARARFDGPIIHVVVVDAAADGGDPSGPPRHAGPAHAPTLAAS
ncbi:MAG: permease [Solirubrobacteraceae bacterium]|nr:permease [Solirubrobacteraceae bacterium]